jgi:septal ring factor EnvC (AmiA/AmiB activator)
MYGGDYQQGVLNERLANQVQNLRRDQYERGLESKLAQCESYLGQWQQYAKDLQTQLAEAKRAIDQQREQLVEAEARMAEAAEHNGEQLRSLESQLEWAQEDCSWMASVVSDYRYGLAPFGYLELPTRHQPRA